MHWPFAKRLRNLTASFTGLVSTRLALFSLELEEELDRQTRRLALLLAVFMFGALGLMFAAVVILTLAWQHGHLLSAAACLSLAFLLGALACVLWLYRNGRHAPRPFEATLAEFRRDEASLRSPAGNDGGDAP